MELLRELVVGEVGEQGNQRHVEGDEPTLELTAASLTIAHTHTHTSTDNGQQTFVLIHLIMLLHVASGP